MKRTLCLIFVFCLLSLCLYSCSDSEQTDNALSFINFPMTVEAAVSCDAGNGKVIMSFIDSEHYSLKYTEPTLMSGVTYERDGDDSYICFGDSRVSVTDGEACMGSLAVAKFFLLSYSMAQTDTWENIDGQNVRVCKYSDESLSCTIYYGQNEIPSKIEGMANGFDAVFTDLIFTYE